MRASILLQEERDIEAQEHLDETDNLASRVDCLAEDVRFLKEEHLVDLVKRKMRCSYERLRDKGFHLLHRRFYPLKARGQDEDIYCGFVE